MEEKEIELRTQAIATLLASMCRGFEDLAEDPATRAAWCRVRERIEGLMPFTRFPDKITLPSKP